MAVVSMETVLVAAGGHCGMVWTDSINSNPTLTGQFDDLERIALYGSFFLEAEKGTGKRRGT